MWWFVQEFKEERKKEFKEGKKKNKKKRKKKGKSVKKKKIKRVLIKFWEVKWKEGVLFWRRRVEKKKCWMEIQKKNWHSDRSWKHFLLFTFTFFYFIPFAFTLHYVLIKSLFDLEDCVVQILIWLNKKCGINSFWHPFMRLLVLSWLSVFMWFICEVLDFAYSILLIYIVESVTPHFRVISFVEW